MTPHEFRVVLTDKTDLSLQDADALCEAGFTVARVEPADLPCSPRSTWN